MKKTLVLSLPEGTVLREAVIGVTSADVSIPALAADSAKLNVSTTSGDLEIR